jgi:hypothetical protein
MSTISELNYSKEENKFEKILQNSTRELYVRSDRRSTLENVPCR